MPENGIPVALPLVMIDDRVGRRNGKVIGRRKLEAAREGEPRGVAKEGSRQRRTDRNKPERRRNYRFRESLG